jgi:hypothetical protein
VTKMAPKRAAIFHHFPTEASVAEASAARSAC